jgi:histidine ammonia-lyase
LRVVRNVESVLAVEYLCAVQGVDFHAPLEPGKGSGAAHRLLRSVVPHLEDDRVLAPELAQARDLIASGRVVEAAEGGIDAEIG